MSHAIFYTMYEQRKIFLQISDFYLECCFSFKKLCDSNDLLVWLSLIRPFTISCNLSKSSTSRNWKSSPPPEVHTAYPFPALWGKQALGLFFPNASVSHWQPFLLLSSIGKNRILYTYHFQGRSFHCLKKIMICRSHGQQLGIFKRILVWITGNYFAANIWLW